MNVFVPVVVAVLNFLGSLGPQLLGFIAQVRESSELTGDGRKLLDSMEQKLEANVREEGELEPLPVPDPPPTAPR